MTNLTQCAYNSHFIYLYYFSIAHLYIVFDDNNYIQHNLQMGGRENICSQNGDDKEKIIIFILLLKKEEVINKKRALNN